MIVSFSTVRVMSSVAPVLFKTREDSGHGDQVPCGPDDQEPDGMDESEYRTTRAIEDVPHVSLKPSFPMTQNL